MPRHGKVQQLLLAILRQHERKPSAQQRAEGLDEYRLVCTAHRKRHPNFAEPVTSNEKRSVHRALKALAREGAVLGVGAPHGGRPIGASTPSIGARTNAPSR
jgi:hypothetical protein